MDPYMRFLRAQIELFEYSQRETSRGQAPQMGDGDSNPLHLTNGDETCPFLSMTMACLMMCSRRLLSSFLADEAVTAAVVWDGHQKTFFDRF